MRGAQMAEVYLASSEPAVIYASEIYLLTPKQMSH